MKRAVIAVIEYLLGFLALTVFAAYAFVHGAPTEDRWVFSFKLGACLAALELLVLARRAVPINRLILGANIWLLVGGLAAFLQQWWLLRGYERFGEASLFAAMLAVGIVSTAVNPRGFVAVSGPRRKVLLASSALLAAVAVALVIAVSFRGNVKVAAVLPVIALSWLNRALQRYAREVA